MSKLVISLVLVLVLVGLARADIGILATNNSYTGTSIKCDDSTDDTTAMQNLITQVSTYNGACTAANTPAACCTGNGTGTCPLTSTAATDFWNRTYITFPAQATCKFNSGLSFNPEFVGFAWDGTTWDFSGMSTAGTSQSATLGTGDGSTTLFSSGNVFIGSHFGVAIVPGSVSITAGAVTATDSSTFGTTPFPPGVYTPITGTGVNTTPAVTSANFPYFGHFEMNFSVAPAVSVPVTATWKTYTPAITMTAGSSPYGAGSTVLRGLHLVGPGRTTNTMGILLQSAHSNFQQPMIHDFGIGVETFNNAYVNTFTAPEIYNAQVDLDMITGSNAGEQTTIIGPQFFNSNYALINAGEVSIEGGSMDFLFNTSIINWGVVKTDHLHMEDAPIAGAPAIEEIGCLAFSWVEMSDPTIQIDGSPSSTQPLVQVDGVNNGLNFVANCTGNGFGGWVKIQGNGAFINNYNASSLSCQRGSNAADCVVGTSTPYTTTPQKVPLVDICDATNAPGGGQPNQVYNVGQCPQ